MQNNTDTCSDKIITIGIPTYRRPESLRKLLSQISNTREFIDNVKVLVVDDSGSDEFTSSYNSVINNLKNIELKFIRNEINVGFPETFLMLLKNCSTEYLMVMADDDLLIKDHFLEILDFLKDKNPDLLSPQWLYRNGKILRSIDNTTRKVKPEEHRHCCGHAPGVIFNASIAKEFIPIVERRIEKNCAATLTYPLVSFSIPLILNYDNCWWFDKPIAREGDACVSGIKDAKGNHYSALASRIQQIAAFDDYVLSFPESAARNKILYASRIWSFQKAINGNNEIKKGVRRYICPSFVTRLLNRVFRLFNLKI